MKLTAHSLVNVKTNEKLAISEFIEKNEDVNAIAGIGDPERFFSTLTQLNFSLDKKQGFVDHQAYNLEDFSDFSSEKALLMTEKDAVKCRHFAQDNWWYLPVDATFEGKEAEQLINQVAQLVEQPN
jgi:tetraacyldisaccharide 4'-kinase